MNTTIEQVREKIRILEGRLEVLERQAQIDAQAREKWEAKKETLVKFADANFGVGNHSWHRVDFDNEESRKDVEDIFKGFEKGFNEALWIVE